jgi:3-oxoadipate enol-lactonase
MPEIDVNGTRLHFRFDGPASGSVIMLSHAIHADLTMWDLQIKPLVDVGFRVLRYDNRGHGKSDTTPGPYSIELLMNDVVALMDVLALQSVYFCGLSMGGMIGQMLAARHSSRLQSLILCATAAHLPPPELWNQRISTARKDGMAALADAAIDRWFTKAGQERLQTEVHSVRNTILTTPIEGYCACCAAIRDMDQRDSIRAITAPTLIIVGELDMGTPVEASTLLHQRIENSKLIVFPHAKHFVNIEYATEFNDALLGFLKP